MVGLKVKLIVPAPSPDFYLHSTMVGLKAVFTFLTILTILYLHSTMVGLKAIMSYKAIPFFHIYIPLWSD